MGFYRGKNIILGPAQRVRFLFNFSLICYDLLHWIVIFLILNSIIVSKTESTHSGVRPFNLK